jgi:chromosome segregation ATPase
MSDPQPFKKKPRAPKPEEVDPRGPDQEGEEDSSAWSPMSGFRKLQGAFTDPKSRLPSSAEGGADSAERRMLRRRLNQMEAAAKRDLEPAPEVPRPPIVLPDIRSSGQRPVEEAWTDSSTRQPPTGRGANGHHRQTFDRPASDHSIFEKTDEELSAALEREEAERRQTRETRADFIREAEADEDLVTTQAEVTAPPRRTNDPHAAERLDWEDRQRQFQGALSAAGAQVVELQNAARSLEEELERERGERQQLEYRYQTAQAAWNVTRRELESRVGQLEAIRDEHVTALATVSMQYQQVVDARAAEQKSLAAAQHHLDSRAEELREVDAGRATAEQALEITSAKLRRTVEDATRAAADLARLTEKRDADVKAWETTRRQLESDLKSARAAAEKANAGREADRQAHKKELKKALDAKRRAESNAVANDGPAPETADAESEDLGDGRASWDATRQQLAIWIATRQQLEAEGDGTRSSGDLQDASLVLREKELQKAIEARTKMQAALAKSEADRQRALNVHAAERAAWNTTRHEIEARLRQVESADGDRQRLQQALDEANARHGQLVSAHRALELQLAETTSRLQQLGADSKNPRQRSETETPFGTRTKFEDRLPQNRRLEEVGRLAGAMVPDITQLVSSIDLCGSELARVLDAADPRREPARAIVAFSQRASGLLRQLLAFSEKQSKPLKTVDVSDSVRRAQSVLDRLAGPDIDLKIRLGATGLISAGEDDVEHLVTALVFSVRDLLPVGGSLTIETHQIDPGQDADPSDPAGQFVLTVSAAGYGMQPPKASAALELVVQRCGGELFFDGTSTAGAVFEVRFPLIASDA